MVACGYAAPKPAASPTPVPSKPGEIVASATYPRFRPSTLSAAKGQVIALRMAASDANHTFTGDELGISVAVGRGQTVAKEVKVAEAGAFKFYRTALGH